MPTSSDLVKQKRAQEQWDAYMAGLRAAEAARVAQPAPAPQPEPPALPEEPPEEQAGG